MWPSPLLVLLLPVVFSAAHTGDITVTLSSGGHNRSALVHLPSPSAATRTPSSIDDDPRSAPSMVPVVVNFHCLAETPSSQEDISGMDIVADKEHFIVVYPQGLLPGNAEKWLPWGVGKSWNGGTCCPKASAEKVDDVTFARDLLAYLEANLPVLTGGRFGMDQTRVYGCGGSNGGFMINRIACQAPELFAAVAPVAGIIGNGTAIAWGYDSYACPAPPRPLPVLHFHGLTDPLVPWVGNPLLGFPSIATYIGQRKQLAGVVANDPGTVTFTNHTVKCTAYGGAANNFTFCKHDAGHCWPGHQAQGPCTMDVDASAQIWQFFTRYRLPAPASLEALLPQRPAVTETHNY